MPKAEEIIKQLRNDYQIVFNSDSGIRVLKDIEMRTGMHKTNFSKDAGEMAFLEGQRAVTLFIKGMLLPQRKEEKK